MSGDTNRLASVDGVGVFSQMSDEDFLHGRAPYATPPRYTSPLPRWSKRRWRQLAVGFRRFTACALGFLVLSGIRHNNNFQQSPELEWNTVSTIIMFSIVPPFIFPSTPPIVRANPRATTCRTLCREMLRDAAVVFLWVIPLVLAGIAQYLYALTWRGIAVLACFSSTGREIVLTFQRLREDRRANTSAMVEWAIYATLVTVVFALYIIPLTEDEDDDPDDTIWPLFAMACFQWHLHWWNTLTSHLILGAMCTLLLSREV